MQVLKLFAVAALLSVVSSVELMSQAEGGWLYRNFTYTPEYWQELQ